MTDEEITKKAQSLVDGKRSVKIDGMWAYNPTYLGRGCLESRSGGIGLAMPSIPIKDSQPSEYANALRIIKKVEQLLNLKGD